MSVPLVREPDASDTDIASPRGTLAAMKITRICAASVVAWASLPALAQPTTAPSPKSPATTAPVVQEEPEEVRISVGRPGEYDALIAELGLEGEQLDRVNVRVQERLDRLEAFAASDEGIKLVELRTQLAAARREKRLDDVPRLRAEVQPFADAYWKVRVETRLAILRELTPEQQVQAAGFSLQQRMLGRVANVSALSSDEREAIRSIARDIARDWLTPEKLQSDPFFRTIDEKLPEALEAMKEQVAPTTQRGQ